MTTINCSLKCIYQQDGLCGRDNTEDNVMSSSSLCAFFKDSLSTASESNNADEKEL